MADPALLALAARAAALGSDATAIKGGMLAAATASIDGLSAKLGALSLDIAAYACPPPGPTGRPDLIVTLVDLGVALPLKVGQVVRVSPKITVLNQGDADVASTVVLGAVVAVNPPKKADGTYQPPISWPTIAYSDTTKGLPVGAAKVLTMNGGADSGFITIPTTAAGTQEVGAYVDNPYPAVGDSGRVLESNELNNMLVLQVPVVAVGPTGPTGATGPGPTGPTGPPGAKADVRATAMAFPPKGDGATATGNWNPANGAVGNVESFENDALGGGRMGGVVQNTPEHKYGTYTDMEHFGQGWIDRGLLTRNPPLEIWPTIVIVNSGNKSQAGPNNRSEAAGANDDHHVKFLAPLKPYASRMRYRIGHEPDVQGGYDWQGNPDWPAWALNFKHRSELYKRENPGCLVVANFDAEMNLIVGTTTFQKTTWGAGPADPSKRGKGEYALSLVAGSFDLVGIDAYLPNGIASWLALVEYAEQAALQYQCGLCVPEWGLSDSVNTSPDDPNLIKQVAAKLASLPAKGLPGGLWMHAYFEGLVSLNGFPNCKAEYRRQFGKV